MEMPLHDRTVVPTDEDFSVAAGTAAPLWADVSRRLAADMGAHPILAWGGRAGWEIRYRRAGRPLVTLTPGPDSFHACVVLGAYESAMAAAAPLGPGIRALLERAHRYPDGTWLFITVRTPEDVTDLLTLLEVKLPKRLREALAGVT
jgi:hypothetical protein